VQIDLYYAPFSCAIVPYIMLTEACIPFTLKPLNIRGKENMTAEYLALNPKHKVPLLVVDGAPLSENISIQSWIAHQAPQARLLPSDPWNEALAISLLSWFASGFHPLISRYNSPLKVCDVPGSEYRTRTLAGNALLKNMEAADKLLEGRKFFFDHFTAADAYMFWCYRRSGFFADLDLSGYKNLAAHSERLFQRPSFQRAVKSDDRIRDQFNLIP
jgi:glutathione S-transferase